jgi:DNA-binding MarR family transcriptional regulator
MNTIAVSKDELLRLAIERFWETFPPAWNRIRGHVRTIAVEQFGITVEQFHILRHIRKGASSVSDLAEVRQISRPGVSQIVDMLVDKGLVDRQRHPDDRRYVQLELTQEGDRLLDAIFRKNQAWMMEKMAVLTPAELDEIMRALEMLRKTFDE